MLVKATFKFTNETLTENVKSFLENVFMEARNEAVNILSEDKYSIWNAEYTGNTEKEYLAYIDKCANSELNKTDHKFDSILKIVSEEGDLVGVSKMLCTKVYLGIIPVEEA